MTTGGPDVVTTEGQRRLKEQGVKPIPVPDEVTAPYWAAAAERRLCCFRCDSCGRLRHPPMSLCPTCGAATGEWADLSGRGVVYSFIVDHRNLVPGFDEPYVVATVVPIEADETVRIVANIRDSSLDEVHIGMPVRVTFEELAPGVVLPQFVPDVEVPA